MGNAMALSFGDEVIHRMLFPSVRRDGILLLLQTCRALCTHLSRWEFWCPMRSVLLSDPRFLECFESAETWARTWAHLSENLRPPFDQCTTRQNKRLYVHFLRHTLSLIGTERVAVGGVFGSIATCADGPDDEGHLVNRYSDAIVYSVQPLGEGVHKVSLRVVLLPVDSRPVLIGVATVGSTLSVNSTTGTGTACVLSSRGVKYGSQVMSPAIKEGVYAQGDVVTMELDTGKNQLWFTVQGISCLCL